MLDFVGIIIAILMIASLVYNNRLPGQVITWRIVPMMVLSVIIPTQSSGLRWTVGCR
jgi:hypothetical protein